MPPNCAGCAMLAAFANLACRKTPRGLVRLADRAVVWTHMARAEARAYLLETLVGN